MTDIRNDDVVQSAAKALFLGCAPERRNDLEALWQYLRPEFQVHDDNHRDGKFIFDAGAYRYVRFNARSMRLFWIGAFIAWEGFSAAPAIGKAPANRSRFQSMLAVFLDLLEAEDPETVSLPSGVSQPGIYVGGHVNAQTQAAAELATIATGWALLHEVRHIRHQQEGTSTNPEEDAPESVRAEEASCDKFATEFLLDQVEQYAAESGDDVGKVRQKRQLGIYLALFTIALISKDNWGTTPTHPSLRDRLDAAKSLFDGYRTEQADHVAALAFEALGQVWPGTPSF